MICRDADSVKFYQDSQPRLNGDEFRRKYRMFQKISNTTKQKNNTIYLNQRIF